MFVVAVVWESDPACWSHKKTINKGDPILQNTLHPLSLLSLSQAQQQILESLTPLPVETVSLHQALGRFSAHSVTSTVPKPSFDQSTRDGYAVNDSVLRCSAGAAIFRLVAEVAAGSLAPVSIQSGEAVRIMTGAPIPFGCTRVIPFEECRELDHTVSVSEQALLIREKFIRFSGQELPVGRVIAGSGKRLLPDNLLMLAENRRTSIDVHRLPKVGVLCTGSELVDPGRELRKGQKVSGNGVLLQALILECGGTCLQVRTAPDSSDHIIARLEEMLLSGPDMIITTGGMGPGKFDLLEKVFSRLDGQVLYNRLEVRPGKSTLYGTLSGVPLFALPGPPPAVRLLFLELVAPALRRLQGMYNPLPKQIEARLLESISAGKSNHLSLKNGVAVLQEGRLSVRSAGRRDAVNVIMHLDGSRKTFAVGDSIPVHLVRPVMDG